MNINKFFIQLKNIILIRGNKIVVQNLIVLHITILRLKTSIIILIKSNG